MTHPDDLSHLSDADVDDLLDQSQGLEAMQVEAAWIDRQVTALLTIFDGKEAP